MIDKDLLKFLYKLKNTNRYATVPVVTYESVAEHSYYVTLFSMMLCDELDIYGDQRVKILQMALIHDLPEAILSDIPTTSKSIFKQFGMDVDSISGELMKSILPPYTGEMIEFEEKETIEALVVKLADIAQCFQYCYHEESLGNTNMEEVIMLINEGYQTIKNKLRKKYKIEPKLFDE